MGESAEDLARSMRELAESMRAEREERRQLAANLDALQQTVSRFVVAMERQLSSGQAVQRRAERVLAAYDPAEVKAMNDQISRRLGKR